MQNLFGGGSLCRFCSVSLGAGTSPSCTLFPSSGLPLQSQMPGLPMHYHIPGPPVLVLLQFLFWRYFLVHVLTCLLHDFTATCMPCVHTLSAGSSLTFTLGMGRPGIFPTVGGCKCHLPRFPASFLPQILPAGRLSYHTVLHLPFTRYTMILEWASPHVQWWNTGPFLEACSRHSFARF